MKFCLSTLLLRIAASRDAMMSSQMQVAGGVACTAQAATQVIPQLVSSDPYPKKIVDIGFSLAHCLVPFGSLAIGQMQSGLDSLNQASRMSIFLSELRPVEVLFEGMDNDEKKDCLSKLWTTLWNQDMSTSKDGQAFLRSFVHGGGFKDDSDMFAQFGQKLLLESKERGHDLGLIAKGIPGVVIGDVRKFDIAALASKKDLAIANNGKWLKELKEQSQQQDRILNLVSSTVTMGQGYIMSCTMELLEWKQTTIDAHAKETQISMDVIEVIIQNARMSVDPIFSGVQKVRGTATQLRQWNVTLGKFEKYLKSDETQQSRHRLEAQKGQHELLKERIVRLIWFQIGLMLVMAIFSVCFFTKLAATPQGTDNGKNVAQHMVIVVLFAISCWYTWKLLLWDMNSWKQLSWKLLVWDMDSSHTTTQLDHLLNSLESLMSQISKHQEGIKWQLGTL